MTPVQTLPSTFLRIGLTLDEALAPPVLPMDLDEAERGIARGMFALLNVQDGQRLALRGAVAQRGFLIVSGRAVAERPMTRSLVLSAGSTIGLSSLRSGRPQRTTVHAVTDLQLLSVGAAEAFRLNVLLPRLATAIDACGSDEIA